MPMLLEETAEDIFDMSRQANSSKRTNNTTQCGLCQTNSAWIMTQG